VPAFNYLFCDGVAELLMGTMFSVTWRSLWCELFFSFSWLLNFFHGTFSNCGLPYSYSGVSSENSRRCHFGLGTGKIKLSLFWNESEMELFSSRTKKLPICRYLAKANVTVYPMIG
jgi:hypothetical protein